MNRCDCWNRQLRWDHLYLQQAELMTGLFVCQTLQTPHPDVSCCCAVALSLAAQQPYDMVAAFLLQTTAHSLLLRAEVCHNAIEQHGEECSPLRWLSQHKDPYLLDWCAALNLSFLVINKTKEALE